MSSDLPPLGSNASDPPPPPSSRRQSAPASYQKPWSVNLGQEQQQADTNVSATVQVFCRFRPTKSDIASKSDSADFPPDAPFGLDLDSHSVCSRASSMFPDGGGRTFHFDRVFAPSAPQSSVYESVEDVVKGVMMGFNGTIMMYGQTSSGKTHSMEGAMTEDLSNPNRGICPRSISTLFSCISESSADMEFTIKLTFVEIYCEKIRDLLEPLSNNIRIKELPSGELVLSGVTEVYVTSEQEVYSVMHTGKANRATAPTLMNAESSRSHSLLMITVEQRDTKTDRVIRARLVLGDLAGSERIKKTQVRGVRLDEAKMINRSLTTLGMVINSLTDGSKHVPYRDSKLTRVLQESLGGNSRTALIVCCAPERVHAQETISTLRFGERASRIKNKIVRNEELSVSELKDLLEKANNEIVMLKGIIVKLEEERGKKSSNKKQSGCSGAPVSQDQLLQMVDDDQFTRDLLREVDNIGLEGDEILTSRLSETSVEDKADILGRQVVVLKQQLKKQRLMQIQAFRTQKELEGELEALRNGGGGGGGETNDGDELQDLGNDDDTDTVTTVDSLAAREKLLELEGIEVALSKERAEHEKSRATILALQETLTALAGEKVKESHAMTPEKVKKSHQFDLHNVLTGGGGEAVVDSPMAEKTPIFESSGAPVMSDIGISTRAVQVEEKSIMTDHGFDFEAEVERLGEEIERLIQEKSVMAAEKESSESVLLAEVDNLKKAVTEMEGTGEERKEGLARLELESVEMKKTIETLANEKEATEEALEGAREEVDIAKEELETFKGENERLELYISNLMENQREKEDENAVLEISNVELKGTIEVMEREEKKRERDVRRLQGLLDKMEVESKERMSEFEGIISGNEERIAELTRELGEARRETAEEKKEKKGGGGDGTPGQLGQLKSLSSELQSMIDDEIEELENELEEAENNALKANRELKAVRDELVATKSESFETEKELRKEISALRKQVEYMNEREERAKESVEKRRSSRGEFWSPSRTFSSDRDGEGGGGFSGSKKAIPGEEDTVEGLRAELDLLEHQYHNNLDAHALVLETKEEVLRSLLKQNASLTMDRSALQRAAEQQQARIETLTEALQAMQKAKHLMGKAGVVRGGGRVGGGAGGGGIRGGGGESPAASPVSGGKGKKTPLTN